MADKITAAVVAFCFSFTTVAASAPPAGSFTTFLSRDSASRNEVRTFSLVDSIDLPASLGAISGRAASGSSSILYLQDAHGSYEAQRNTEKILSRLTQEHKVETIFLEGGFEKLEGSRLQFFKDPALSRQFAERLAEKSLAGGVELFLLDAWLKNGRNSSLRAYGVEDPALYRENFEAFRAVLNLKNESGRFLSRLKSAVLKESARLFNKKLKSFFRERLFYAEAGSAELQGRLETLRAYSLRELGLDLEDARNQIDWPQLVRIAKMKILEKRRAPEAAQREAETLSQWARQSNLPNDAIPCLKDFNEACRKVSAPREFFEAFYKAAAPKGFDFKTYPHLSAEIGLLILQSELDAAALFEEVEKLTDRILAKLAQTDSERALVNLYKDYLLLRSLFSLELVSEDYETVKKRAGELKPSVLLKRLEEVEKKQEARSRKQETDSRGQSKISAKKWTDSSSGEQNLRQTSLDGSVLRRTKFKIQSPHSPFLIPQFDPDDLFRQALLFYDGAKKREAALFENMVTKMKELGESNAILAAGGFHEGGLSERIRASQISYLSIVPRMTQVEDRSKYLDAMFLGAGGDSASKSQIRLTTLAMFQSETNTMAGQNFETALASRIRSELRAFAIEQGLSPAELKDALQPGNEWFGGKKVSEESAEAGSEKQEASQLRSEARNEFEELKNWWHETGGRSSFSSLEKKLAAAFSVVFGTETRLRIYPLGHADSRVAEFLTGRGRFMILASQAGVELYTPHEGELERSGFDWPWLEQHFSSHQITAFLTGAEPLERISLLKEIYEQLAEYAQVNVGDQSQRGELADTAYHIAKSGKTAWLAAQRLMRYLERSLDFNPQKLNASQKKRLLTVLYKVGTAKSAGYLRFLQFLRAVKFRFRLRLRELSSGEKLRIFTAAYATGSNLKTFNDTLEAIEKKFDLTDAELKTLELSDKIRLITAAYEENLGKKKREIRSELRAFAIEQGLSPAELKDALQPGNEWFGGKKVSEESAEAGSEKQEASQLRAEAREKESSKLEVRSWKSGIGRKGYEKDQEEILPRLLSRLRKAEGESTVVLPMLLSILMSLSPETMISEAYAQLRTGRSFGSRTSTDESLGVTKHPSRRISSMSSARSAVEKHPENLGRRRTSVSSETSSSDVMSVNAPPRNASRISRQEADRRSAATNTLVSMRTRMSSGSSDGRNLGVDFPHGKPTAFQLPVDRLKKPVPSIPARSLNQFLHKLQTFFHAQLIDNAFGSFQQILTHIRELTGDFFPSQPDLRSELREQNGNAGRGMSHVLSSPIPHFSFLTTGLFRSEVRGHRKVKSAASSLPHRMDVNTASQTELMELLGLLKSGAHGGHQEKKQGKKARSLEKLANRIIEARRNRAFANPSDVKARVDGIGPGALKQLQKMLKEKRIAFGKAVSKETTAGKSIFHQSAVAVLLALFFEMAAPIAAGFEKLDNQGLHPRMLLSAAEASGAMGVGGVFAGQAVRHYYLKDPKVAEAVSLMDQNLESRFPRQFSEPPPVVRSVSPFPNLTARDVTPLPTDSRSGFLPESEALLASGSKSDAADTERGAIFTKRAKVPEGLAFLYTDGTANFHSLDELRVGLASKTIKEVTVIFVDEDGHEASVPLTGIGKKEQVFSIPFRQIPGIENVDIGRIREIRFMAAGGAKGKLEVNILPSILAAAPDPSRTVEEITRIREIRGGESGFPRLEPLLRSQSSKSVVEDTGRGGKIAKKGEKGEEGFAFVWGEPADLSGLEEIVIGVKSALKGKKAGVNVKGAQMIVTDARGNSRSVPLSGIGASESVIRVPASELTGVNLREVKSVAFTIRKGTLEVSLVPVFKSRYPSAVAETVFERFPNQQENRVEILFDPEVSVFKADTRELISKIPAAVVKWFYDVEKEGSWAALNLLHWDVPEDLRRHLHKNASGEFFFLLELALETLKGRSKQVPLNIEFVNSSNRKLTIPVAGLEEFFQTFNIPFDRIESKSREKGFDFTELTDVNLVFANDGPLGIRSKADRVGALKIVRVGDLPFLIPGSGEPTDLSDLEVGAGPMAPAVNGTRVLRNTVRAFNQTDAEHVNALFDLNEGEDRDFSRWAGYLFNFGSENDPSTWLDFTKLEDETFRFRVRSPGPESNSRIKAAVISSDPTDPLNHDLQRPVELQVVGIREGEFITVEIPKSKLDFAQARGFDARHVSFLSLVFDPQTADPGRFPDPKSAVAAFEVEMEGLIFVPKIPAEDGLTLSDMDDFNPLPTLVDKNGVIDNFTHDATGFQFDFNLGNQPNPIRRDAFVMLPFTQVRPDLTRQDLVFFVRGVSQIKVSVSDDKEVTFPDGTKGFRPESLLFTDIPPEGGFVRITGERIGQTNDTFDIREITSVSFAVDETTQGERASGQVEVVSEGLIPPPIVIPVPPGARSEMRMGGDKKIVTEEVIITAIQLAKDAGAKNRSGVGKQYEEAVRILEMYAKESMGGSAWRASLNVLSVSVYIANQVRNVEEAIGVINVAEKFVNDALRRSEMREEKKMQEAGSKKQGLTKHSGFRPFGSTGLEFFALGLGTIWMGRKWPQNDAAYADPAEKEIDAYLKTAFEGMGDKDGKVLIDTARAYGMSEERIGKFLKRHPELMERAFIATKWGEEFDIQTGQSTTDHSVSNLKDSVAKSLDRLGKVDLLYIHKTSLEVLHNVEVIREMQWMKKENYGGIRLFGVSISPETVLEKAVEENLLEGFDVIQMPAPLFVKRADLVRAIYRQGLAIVLNSPVRLSNGQQPKDVYVNLLRRPEVSMILTGTRTHLAETIGYISEAARSETREASPAEIQFSDVDRSIEELRRRRDTVGDRVSIPLNTDIFPEGPSHRIFADGTDTVIHEPDYLSDLILSLIRSNSNYSKEMNDRSRQAVENLIKTTYRSLPTEITPANKKEAIREWGKFTRLLLGGYEIEIPENQGTIDYRVPQVTQADIRKFILPQALIPAFFLGLKEYKSRNGIPENGRLALTIISRAPHDFYAAFFEREDIQAQMAMFGVEEVQTIGIKVKPKSARFDDFDIEYGPVRKEDYVFPANGEYFLGDDKDAPAFLKYGVRFINVETIRRDRDSEALDYFQNTVRRSEAREGKAEDKRRKEETGSNKLQPETPTADYLEWLNENWIPLAELDKWHRPWPLKDSRGNVIEGKMRLRSEHVKIAAQALDALIAGESENFIKLDRFTAIKREKVEEISKEVRNLSDRGKKILVEAVALHDFGDFELENGRAHQEKGAERAQEFLESQNEDLLIREAVSKVILGHSDPYNLAIGHVDARNPRRLPYFFLGENDVTRWIQELVAGVYLHKNEVSSFISELKTIFYVIGLVDVHASGDRHLTNDVLFKMNAEVAHVFNRVEENLTEKKRSESRAEVREEKAERGRGKAEWKEPEKRRRPVDYVRMISLASTASGVVSFTNAFIRLMTFDMVGGRTRRQTIPAVEAAGYRFESEKSLSWLKSVLISLLASAYTWPFLRPFGDFMTSQPKSLNARMSLPWIISSVRNRNGLSEEGTGMTALPIDQFTGKVKRRLNGALRKGRITFQNVVNRVSALYHLKNQRHGDARTAETELSVTNATVPAHIFSDQNRSHIITFTKDPNILLKISQQMRRVRSEARTELVKQKSQKRRGRKKGSISTGMERFLKYLEPYEQRGETKIPDTREELATRFGLSTKSVDRALEAKQIAASHKKRSSGTVQFLQYLKSYQDRGENTVLLTREELATRFGLSTKSVDRTLKVKQMTAARKKPITRRKRPGPPISANMKKFLQYLKFYQERKESTTTETRGELAERFGVSTRTVDRALKEEVMKATRERKAARSEVREEEKVEGGGWRVETKPRIQSAVGRTQAQEAGAVRRNRIRHGSKSVAHGARRKVGPAPNTKHQAPSAEYRAPVTNHQSLFTSRSSITIHDPRSTGLEAPPAERYALTSEVTEVAKETEWVFMQQMAELIGRAELRRFLHKQSPEQFPLKAEVGDSFLLLSNPEEAAAAQIRIAAVFDDLPASLNDSRLRVLIDFLSRNQFAQVQILIPGAERAQTIGFGRLMVLAVLEKRAAHGLVSKGVNVNVVSDESTARKFVFSSQTRTVVFDPRKEALENLEANLKNRSETLLVLDNALLDQKALALLASINTAVQQAAVPQGIQTAQDILKLVENLRIAAQADTLVSQAA